MPPPTQTTDGRTLWRYPEEIGFDAGEWIRWGGKEWFNKDKDTTINEVVGYQLAATIDIPLQPSIAYIQGIDSYWREEKWSVGLLVERWVDAEAQVSIPWAKITHPKLVAKALTLAIFDRFEWPVWLINKHSKDIRLIDLERIAPILRWPPQRTRIKNYRRSTKVAHLECKEAAIKAGVQKEFDYEVERILKLDFSTVIDFSGHPYSAAITRTFVNALRARQTKVNSMVHGDIKSRKTIECEPRERRTYRRSFTRRVAFDHPKRGVMTAFIDVSPAPRETWTVRWDIGSIDNDMALSKWFAQRRYDLELSHFIDGVIETGDMRPRSHSSSPRWGFLDRLSNAAAKSVAGWIEMFWARIVQDWRVEVDGKIGKGGSRLNALRPLYYTRTDD